MFLSSEVFCLGSGVLVVFSLTITHDTLVSISLRFRLCNDCSLRLSDSCLLFARRLGVHRPSRGQFAPETPDQTVVSTMPLTSKIFASSHWKQSLNLLDGTTYARMMLPNTADAKKHSPTLTRLLKARPAPSRETNLLNAAFSTTKPVKPPPGECCGSSCDPCVMDLYAQELKVWKECAAYREVLGGGSEAAETVASEDSVMETLPCKVPGAFEW